MSRAPKDYWQDRAIQAEMATVKIAGLLHAHFPAMRADLEHIRDEWNRIIDEVEKAYPEIPIDSPE
jgi:hypothetical protein